MQKIKKYISRYLLIFVGTITAIVIINILLFMFAFQGVIKNNYGNSSPSTVIEQTVNALSIQNGNYQLEQLQQDFLHSQTIWALLISIDGNVVWNFELPEGIPKYYSLQDVATLSRGYVQDYPVFVWKYDDGLLVLGYPQSSYTKIMANYLPLKATKVAPLFFVGLFVFDMLMLFIAYFISKRSIARNVMPIVDAVTQLSQGQTVNLITTGDLSEIGNSLNMTSAILDKKDKSRANWISGVSHDIRTPLSIIMGYADRIATNDKLPTETKEQALIIRNQSQKIKGLIQDLNLASQLEYGMQPLHTEQIFFAKLLRELIAEYLNNGLDVKFSLDLEITEDTQEFTMNGDKALLKRAMGNLVQNSICHNPQGCAISIKMVSIANKRNIIFSDNGRGVSESELGKILNTPHYMNSTDESLNLRHGMGLLIVQQIISAHHGTVQFQSQPEQGFTVSILF